MPTHSTLIELSAAQRKRLAYIEFKVWFHGEIARKHVLERFELATAAGTRDLSLYKELAPGNVCYERKAYRYAPGFRPIFQHDVGQVLAALTTGLGAGEPATTGELLSHAVPAHLNLPSLETLATVTRAICASQVLALNYQSMKNGPEPREIVPHSLVDSGLRWHVRAFDRTKGHFRDLVLTRMERVAPKKSARALAPEERASADAQWHRQVSLTLLPHPSHLHPKVIARDFGMQRGRLNVTLRAAMAGYVLRQWQVDCSRDAHLKGPAFRLWLPDPTQLDGVGSAPLAPGFQAGTNR
ncbi:WYL domain-containing protein [Hydrogenophaga sp. PAMC20947]|nr:WYL domain-containing protein [Hydrogenophaga sp. PAMC20947]